MVNLQPAHPVKVARTPFKPSSGTLQSGALIDPFQRDPDPASVIQPAEDFTISINTLSKELYSQYSGAYRAGKYGNDYFILLSRIGLGDQARPTLKLNFMEHIRDMNRDYTDLWAENVATVEDYAKGGGAQRLYISFHAFCQDLGGSRLEDMQEAGNQILGATGAIFPALMPFTSIGQAVVAGIKNIFFKLSEKAGESKRVEFNLYPVLAGQGAIPGEAPLQEGSYVIFFEDMNIRNLYLDSSGIVRSPSADPIKPYIVVNIKKGKRLAPDSLDVNVATQVLSHYQANYTYLLPASANNTRDSGSGFLGALKEFGNAYRVVQAMQRYEQLKGQPVRSKAEEAKLQELALFLKNYFNRSNWDPLI
jgi:hypothetical protein